jgi:hypothetical protein
VSKLHDENSLDKSKMMWGKDFDPDNIRAWVAKGAFVDWHNPDECVRVCMCVCAGVQGRMGVDFVGRFRGLRFALASFLYSHRSTGRDCHHAHSPRRPGGAVHSSTW